MIGESEGAITRRSLFSAAGAAVMLGVHTQTSSLLAAEGEEGEIWDCHTHMSGVTGTPEERVDELLRYADRMGIARLAVSMGLRFVYDPSPEEVVKQNDDVLRAVEHGKGRVLGFVMLNPRHTEVSLKELDRCVGNGPMVGVKLWMAMRCNEPALDPIAARAAELKAPILQHTFWRTGEPIENESFPADVAELAARHPELMLICEHGGRLGQGAAIRAQPYVWADICGCDPTAGMVEMLVRELGAERVLYGSDAGGRSFASQLAKVQGADIPAESRRLILGDNFRRLLAPILRSKGMKT